MGQPVASRNELRLHPSWRYKDAVIGTTTVEVAITV